MDVSAFVEKKSTKIENRFIIIGEVFIGSLRLRITDIKKLKNDYT